MSSSQSQEQGHGQPPSSGSLEEEESELELLLEEELELDHPGEPLHADYSVALASQYFNLRKLSIFGGSNEIQKNIVAKMILEL